MKIYFTIAGTKHHYGQEFMEKDMKVRLEKEPDNEYDTEAVKVMMDGLGLVGYVANSPYTVLGESYSAGRLYDKIGDTAEGTILYVLDKGVLCFLETGDTRPGGMIGITPAGFRLWKKRWLCLAGLKQNTSELPTE